MPPSQDLNAGDGSIGGRSGSVREPKALPDLVPKVPFHKRHRWLLIALAALVLAFLALLVKPAYRAANRWRACRLADSALDHARQNELDKALLQARAAYQLKPDESYVVRAAAKVLTLRHDPMAFRFWQLLSKSPAATPDDRRSYVQSALDLRLISPALEELTALMSLEPKSAANHLLASKLKALTGDFAGSLALARQAHDLDRSNEEVSLFLASLQINSPDAHAAGLQLLWQLADGKTRQGLSAAAILGRQSGLSPEEQDRLIARLKSHPLATESERLLALELEIARHPEQRDPLLKAAGEKYRLMGGEDLRQFGIWLNSHGESARTIEVISLDQAVTRKDLFLVYLDAISAQKKWADVNAALSRSGLPLDEAYVELYKSRACAELGDADGADKHWRQAQIAAQRSAGTGNPEQAFYIANYAERLGQPANAERMYRYLTSSPLTARTACESLLRLAMAKGTRATRDVLREMQARWPEDIAVQNDFAYFQLLLGEEIDASREKAVELVTKFPESLPHRATLALGHLRSGNPGAALKVFDSVSVAWDKAPEPSIAVYSAVLNANGRTDEARVLASRLHAATLRPEEQELIGIGFRKATPDVQ